MKIDKDLRLLVKRAMEFREKGMSRTSNAVSAWADEKKLSIGRYHYCHASMDGIYHDIPVPKVLLSQVQQEVVDLSHIRTYFEWLFNYSPFAPCFITKSAKSAIDKKVIALTPEQPSNLIGGALIATRLGTERYTAQYRIAARLLMWSKLVTLGVHPSLAFTLSHVPSFPKIKGDDLNIKDVEIVNWKDYHVGHEALSPLQEFYGYSIEGSYRSTSGLVTHTNFFNNRQPGVDTKTFAERKSRQGSSFLWIGKDPTPKFNVNKFVSDILRKELKSEKPSSNPFAKAKLEPDSQNQYPFHEAMEVIAKISPDIIKELECAK
jgi:hypothetical protein